MLNLLNFMGEIYQKLWEDSQKVVEKIAEGDVSIYFYLVLGIGMVVLTITIRMLKKIKRIRKTFSGTKEEKKNLYEKLYFGTWDKEGNHRITRGVQDEAYGYLVIGIFTTILSFIFFIDLASLLLGVIGMIIVPLLVVIFLLLLCLLGIKGIRETTNQINKLEKKVQNRNEKVKENQKEDEND